MEVGLIGEKAAQPINSRQLSNNLETLLPTVQCSFFADAISPTSTGDSCYSMTLVLMIVAFSIDQG